MRLGRNVFLLLSLLFIQQSIFSEIPKGYYQYIDGKKERELKTSLHKTIKDHTVLRYGELWYYYRTTDVKSDGTIWDMYSDSTSYFSETPGKSTEGLQKEHALPKSWWGVSSTVEKYAAYTDLHHLYPANGEANLAKSNFILGEVGSSVSFDNKVSKIGRNAYNYSGAPEVSAFEPADEYKGDFARTYLYMITCYEDYAQQWRLYALDMFRAETYPVLKPWAKDMLLKWHKQDPVSEKELRRNEEVYKYQSNRNPFIDFPELVDYIWGEKSNVNFVLPEEYKVTEPAIISPAEMTELYFGDLKIDAEVEKTITLKSLLLTGNVSLQVSGTGSNYFSLSETSIPSAKVNSQDGHPVDITFKPKAYGEYNVSLKITGGGLDAPVVISLKGICSEGGSSGGVLVFSEDFDKFIMAGDPPSMAHYTDVSTTLNKYTKLPGWRGAAVYCAADKIKLGKTEGLGWIETPEINLTGDDGKLSLTFKAMAWNNDSRSMKVFLDDKLVYTITDLPNNNDYALKAYSIDLEGGTLSSKIRFEGEQESKNRFFLDDLNIYVINGSDEPPLSQDATLKLLMVGNDAIPLLTGVVDYNYEISGSLTIMPAISAIPNDETAFVDWANALVPTLEDIRSGSRNKAEIPVIAEDGTTLKYTITFSIGETPQFFEDFENITGSGASNYNGKEVTFASGNWFIKGMTNMDANDRYNGSRSVRLRGNAGDTEHRVEMLFDKPKGAGTVSFTYASYSGHANGVLQVFVSTDQGLTWTAKGEEIVVPSWTNVGEQMSKANVSVNVEGNVRIKIQKTNAAGTSSVNVDDISISDYPTVGLGDLGSSEIYFYTENNILYIVNSETNDSFSVFDISGRMIAHTDAKAIHLPGKGVYLIKTNNGTYKTTNY